MAGKVGLDQAQLQTALRPESTTPQSCGTRRFTKREQRVVSFVFEGLANKEIASRIGGSEFRQVCTSAAFFQEWSPDAQPIGSHRLRAASGSDIARQRGGEGGIATPWSAVSVLKTSQV